MQIKKSGRHFFPFKMSQGEILRPTGIAAAG
jgi:hypothetical protein